MSTEPAAGQIDADKLDYLVRDSTNLNVPFGLAIDFKRLLQCLTVIYKSQDHKLFVALGIHEKGKVPAESVAFARYAMFGTVYWHHTSRAAKAMLHRAVWEGLPQRTQRGSYRSYHSQLIDFVLTGSRGEEQKELFDPHIAHEELSQVLPSDREIIDWISQRTTEPGKKLLRMLIERQLFRRVLVLSEGKSSIWKKLLSIRERHHEAIIELQREVQRSVVEHILSGNFGSESDRGALKNSHDSGDVLILIDVPTQRPGSQIPLEYLPESDRPDFIEEWTQPARLEDSVIWNTLHESFLESVGKTRVFCHPDYRNLIRCIQQTPFEEIIEMSLRVVY